VIGVDKPNRLTYGNEVEDWVADTFFIGKVSRSSGPDLSKYDLRGILPGIGLIKVEVKCSSAYKDSRAFIKYLSSSDYGKTWHKSGIDVTTADYWLIYKKEKAYFVRTDLLRAAYDQAIFDGGDNFVESQQNGSNATPDKGILVSVQPYREEKYDLPEGKFQ
jgi:hypothetical protein